MSAYLVCKETIDLILSAAIETKLYWDGEYLTADRAESVGLMLWAENAKSVGHRYSERPDDVSQYRLARYFNVQIPAAISCIRCLDYQSCEHDAWEASRAKAFLNAAVWHFANKLAGESAPWGVTASSIKAFASGPIATPSPEFRARARAALDNLQAARNGRSMPIGETLAAARTVTAAANVIPLRPAPIAAPIAAPAPAPKQARAPRQAAPRKPAAAIDRDAFKARLLARLSK